ncbi:MAG: peroxiredoxin [Deltaproteobacteria bacterium]|nr:peroxiredoxin [Deltaproteobacteria bacterium]
MGVLVGKQAPDFKASAVINGDIKADYNLSQFKGKKYVLLFFYPLDFTFVCPTELHAFQEKLKQFEEKNVQVIGCSVDSHYSHLAWTNTPKKNGGIQGVTYPLVSDLNKTIARDYDVLIDGAGIALRGLFLIDKEGVVRHQVVNDLPLGRNTDEALRMVDALQFFEKHGEVCPANWTEGKQTMKPDSTGLKKYFA